MAKKLILFVTVILTLLSLPSAPSQTILNAAETLSDSGYDAMSLTLELLSETLIPQSNPSTTIFCPPDSAFAASGQPSLPLLQLHFSPVSLSIDSLRSLPFGAEIPTLSPGNSLTVTSLPSDKTVSINNVAVSGSPIYDDGSVIVYGIENFFDLNSAVSPRNQSAIQDSQCVPSIESRQSSFDYVSDLLRSTGYSMMASFLDLQLLGFVENRTLTVFAPVDEVMSEYSGDIPNYSSLFLRHILPCKVTFTDLVELKNGTALDTYLEGFSVNVTLSGSSNAFMVNGVPITFPEMYVNDWLIVHGLRETIPMAEATEPEDETVDGADKDSILPDRSEF